jgi:hypothetical protein
MTNRIFINKLGFIEHHYEGPQTSSTVSQGMQEAQKKIDHLKKLSKPVKLLVDISKVTTNDAGSRLAAVNSFKNLKYDKLAIFGGNTYLKYLAKLVVRAAKKPTSKLQAFNNQQEAIDWLLQ